MGLICSPAQKPSGSPSKPFPGLNLHILGVAHAANTNWTWSPSPLRAERAVGFPRDRSPHQVLDCPPARAAAVGIPPSLGESTRPMERLEARRQGSESLLALGRQESWSSLPQGRNDQDAQCTEAPK